MKRLLLVTIILTLLGTGCTRPEQPAQLVATTQPVYEFTSYLCKNTGLEVTCLITENVACLHDYTLQTKQMRAVEAAELLIKSGAGMEDFLGDLLKNEEIIIDCSEAIALICSKSDLTDDHKHIAEQNGHHHEEDPHIWLSPANAKIMVSNIYDGLLARYPIYQKTFQENRDKLDAELIALEQYGKTELSSLSSREIITFHDGFAYLAQAFDLKIIHAIEEESGREASAGELIEIIRLVEENKIKAIFTETNGSISAAEIIQAETNVPLFQLDMCMGERNYFEAMYHNINTLKEALE